MRTLKGHQIVFILYACLFSLLPQVCFSLGFGQIKLYSYLNEPLDAAIELEGAEDIDPSHLIVSLASVEDFKRIELARPYFLSNLRFEVVQQNKKAILKVTSEEAIKQPYLEFLVLLTWPEGRVVRDYTLLLDPAPLGGASHPHPSLGSTFQDPAALAALEQKKTEPENTIRPTEIAEAKNTVGITDVPGGVIVDTTTNVIAEIPKSVIPNMPSVISENPKNPESLENQENIAPKPLFSSNQIFIGSGLLALLFTVSLTTVLFKRTRNRVRTPIISNMQFSEDIVIFDEEIKLKLDLANQYIAYEDMESAEAILAEIISRGNSEEIKLAKVLLKKINHS